MRSGAWTERRALIGLALLVVLAGAFTLSFPHSFERPTVPDEGAYHGWARLFDEGYLAVPIEEWVGLDPLSPDSRVELHFNATGFHYFHINASVAALNGAAADDVRVSVLWQDGSPVPGAQVALLSPAPAPALRAATDSGGNATFFDVATGVHRVIANLVRPPAPGIEGLNLSAQGLVAVPPASTPYWVRLGLTSTSGAMARVQAADMFGTPLGGASVTLAAKTPKGLVNVSVQSTDADGTATFSLSGTGDFVLTGSKTGVGWRIGGASVVTVGGHYYVVNRYAPGYQILLGLFMLVGLEPFTTVLLLALAAASVYVLARRLFGWQAAVLSTALLVTCSIVLLSVFTAGMADVASMTFALLGLTLFVEGVEGPRQGVRRMVLLAASGIAFGVAVWTRYSTVTVVAAPLAYLVVRAIAEWRSSTPRAWKPPAKSLLFRGAPFLLGLVLLGAPLAVYNATYFGSPFASGYSYGTIEIKGLGDNATSPPLMTGTFYENFNPVAALQTVPSRLAWLVAMAPFVLLLPLAVRRQWRRWPSELLLWTFLSNFLLYLSVPWVAAWASDPARSMEDIRYFLPAIPSAALLAAVVLAEEVASGGRRRRRALALTAAFVVAGFAVAAFAIGLQLSRHMLLGSPPP